MFYFRLCKELGYPHPDHLLRQLTSSQLTEWIAYSMVEPFGTDIQDLRMGMICTVIANFFTWAYSDPKKKAKTFQPKDFIPDYLAQEEKKAKPKQTTEDIRAILQTFL